MLDRFNRRTGIPPSARPKVPWFVGDRLDFQSQRSDVIIHRPRRRRVLVTPDLAQKFLAREQLPSACHQPPHYPELLSRQLQGTARIAGLVALNVHLQVAHARLFRQRADRTSTPQQGTHPRPELGPQRRLHHGIIRPQVQSHDTVDLLPARGPH